MKYQMLSTFSWKSDYRKQLYYIDLVVLQPQECPDALQGDCLIQALLLSVIVAARADAFECNVCHSKNPAMVRMHQALKGLSCFGCHKMWAKLMGKGLSKDKESLLKRRQTEDVCLPCHTKPGSL